ncbi:olfactory receptor 9I1-like [Tachyglossus aculeatus]|uniref:olfactory receptor 9I1-like n=1 Tax=Tachyglossus aculeatus TaxID=9261 RepID=UPI0018F341EC|nr:olfactory receptor 9I1-like [Tachyglossus aculeatus]
MAENGTEGTEFLLTGFPGRLELQRVLFWVFLVFYLLTLGGNLGIFGLIRVDTHLQTPMYFFLCHLSILDACYSSVIVPQLLVALSSGGASVTSGRCAAQFFLFTLFGTTECFLLAVMAYDRYVAVCHPLLYVAIMTPWARWGLVSGAYAGGQLSSMIRTGCTFSLSFCKSHHVDFFFCDLPPLLKLSCSDTKAQELVIYLVAFTVITTTMTVILVSYLFIIKAILCIRSAGGRAKTFSTCGSHMTAVALFFGTLAFMYLKGNMGQALEVDKVVSVFYTVVIPMLNPMIYSLRNKEVKEALRKILHRTKIMKGHKRSTPTLS